MNLEFVMLEDTYATTVCERTELAPEGLNGGKEGLANNCYVVESDNKKSVPKATRVLVKKEIVFLSNVAAEVATDLLMIEITIRS